MATSSPTASAFAPTATAATTSTSTAQPRSTVTTESNQQHAGQAAKAALLKRYVQQSALIEGHCSDITILAIGRSYKLHRIFLVQSAFFSSLLQGGFSEGASYIAPGLASNDQHRNALPINFDDPNITRPAFEFCIAHLYGAAPELILPPWALPCPAAPLSSAWPPTPFLTPIETTHLQRSHEVSAERMPATPRFLVSLLATSIYLGIPTITASTLTLILSSFTPFTIATYLRFALGKHIVGAYEARERDAEDIDTWDWELEGPCWGLEGIGERTSSFDSQEGVGDSPSPPASSSLHPGTAISRNLSDDGLWETGSEEKPQRSSSIQTSSSKTPQRAHLSQNFSTPETSMRSAGSDTIPVSDPVLDYGPISHRIAESAFCFLSKWGADITEEEYRKWQLIEPALSSWLHHMDRHGWEDAGSLVYCEAASTCLVPRGHIPASVEMPADFASPSRLPADKAKSVPVTVWDIPNPPLCVFGHPAFSHVAVNTNRRGRAQECIDSRYELGESNSLGISSSHLVDLLSSDAFFVKTELERYNTARNIVSMRRMQKALASELETVLDSLTGSTTEDAASGSKQNIKAEYEDALASSPDQPIASRTRQGHSRASSSVSVSGSRAPQTPSRRHGIANLSIQDDDSMEIDRSHTRADTIDEDFEVLDTDDTQYLRLFKDGIFYSHMSFGDLQRIAKEAEAASGAGEESDDDAEEEDFRLRRPSKAISRIFAPLQTLQAALWTGSELKNHILSSHEGATHEAGFGPSSQEPLSGDGIRRGLAFAAEGSSLGLMTDRSGRGIDGAGARLSPSASNDKDESLLGISSSLKEFSEAYQQIIGATPRRGAAGGRSRMASSTLGTPSSRNLRSAASASPPASLSSSPLRSGGVGGLASSTPVTSLGGLAYTPLSGAFSSGAGGAAKTLLAKRYFSVPVDDTVRFGEYFSGLLSGFSSSNVAGDTLSAFNPAINDANGLAAMKDPLSLPILSLGGAGRNQTRHSSLLLPGLEEPSPLLASIDQFLVGGKYSDLRRSRGDLFGLRNKSGGGRMLGKTGLEVARRTIALDMAFGKHKGSVSTRGITSSTHNPDDSTVSVGSVYHSSSTHERPARDVDASSDADAAPGATAADEEGRDATSAGQSGKAGHSATASGLQEDNEQLDYGIQLAKLERRRWTGFEPMRIGIEYFGLDHLEEKQRLYSPTFFYAGSVWNLYVQILKRPRRSTQLGVYLHRQNPDEPLPPSTASPEEVARFYTEGGSLGRREAGAMSESRGNSHTQQIQHHPSSSFLPTRNDAHANESTTASSTRPYATLSPPSLTIPDGPPVLPGISPAIPYRDSRRLVRAYFSIHCHSPLGSSITNFHSAPDVFTTSQSWGWRSSSLMGVWELSGGRLEGGKVEGMDDFRCVVCMGVI